MRQRKTFYLLVRGPLIAFMIVALCAAAFISYQQFSSAHVVEAQVRPQQKKTRSKRKVPSRPPLFVASFKHESHRAPKTKLNCSDCHTIPTQAASDVIAAATKPSIKGYPYHDSCLGCHRQTPPQFFRGTTPSICTVCHTRSSPRLTARDMNRFPGQNKQAIAQEFPGYFPHEHRDHKRVNCATCHMTDERAYIAITVGDGEASHLPTAGTFKTSPSGHAACFKCHWEEKPVKDDCAGCHLTPPEVAKKQRHTLSTNAMEWFSRWPREWPKRISLKFNHESESHVEECITCHANSAEMETLYIPKADVPITACSKCHLKPTTPASLAKEMFEEDEDIAEGRNNIPISKEGKHSCTGCHTAIIGSMPPPCSHYLLFDDTYLKIEDYPKSAKQISERCKK